MDDIGGEIGGNMPIPFNHKSWRKRLKKYNDLNYNYYSSISNNGYFSFEGRPAIFVYDNNEKIIEQRWIFNNVDYTVDINKWCKEMNINIDYRTWSNENRLLFKIVWQP